MIRIPVIQARGNHYEVGFQIGQTARSALHRMHEDERTGFGGSWSQLVEQSQPFLAAAERHLPHVVEEVRGCADGAGIPFDDLFLMSVEELLCGEVCPPFVLAQGEGRKGCSDIAAAPPATADGHVWLAHNNDLNPRAVEDLYVTYFCADGEPEILAITIGGLFISIGFNRAGISLTGNQLYANDSRIGVPRLLIVRDILAQNNFDSALQAALLPERASSYNNLIASREGRIVNVEGSATDCQLIWAERGGTFHANHYLSPRMTHLENEAHPTQPSAARCARARDYVQDYHGQISRGVCQNFLRDHVYAPWSVCKHAGQSVTVFSAIIDLTDGRMWLARGNPCQNEYEEISFETTVG